MLVNGVDMQTVIKTPTTANFSILDNAVINADVLTIKAKAVLIYLLTKPKDWQLRVGDIKRKLHIGTHSIRSALKNLMQAGYIFYRRLASGHTIWTIYDTPQSITQPVDIQPQTDNPHADFQHVIVNTDKPLSIKIQQHAMLEQSVETVVVSLKNENQSDIVEQSELIEQALESTDLVYPDQLDVKQKKTARHILKTRLKRQEMGQELLFALSYAMTSKEIKSIPAYFSGLVNAANNGTFTTISSATSKPLSKPIIPLWVSPPANPTPKDKAKGFIGGLRDALRGG